MWQRQGSGLSVVAQNSVTLPGLEQIESRVGPKMTAYPVKLPGVKASRGHSAKLPRRSQRTYRKGKQPTTRSVSGGPRCSLLRPKRWEVRASALVWYPDHLVELASLLATTGCLICPCWKSGSKQTWELHQKTRDRNGQQVESISTNADRSASAARYCIVTSLLKIALLPFA